MVTLIECTSNTHIDYVTIHIVLYVSVVVVIVVVQARSCRQMGTFTSSKKH